MAEKARKKANELYQERPPLFVRQGQFGEVFPDIESVTVDVEESGYGAGRYRGNPVCANYETHNLPGEFINCSNPKCYRGGFSIGRILRHMASQKQTSHSTDEVCRGHEASPKGKRIDRKCLNTFGIRISVRYKKS